MGAVVFAIVPFITEDAEIFQNFATLSLSAWAIFGEAASYFRKKHEGWREDYEYCGVVLKDDPSDIELFLAPCRCCCRRATL